MVEAFDPYESWLGISKAEQPADYYRLLGLSRFETDREAIRKAAEERLTLVKAHKIGPHARYAQKVAGQLSKACSCLLNPHRKGLYDQYLKSFEGGRPGAIWPPVDTQSDVETETEEASQAPKRWLGLTRPAAMATAAMLVLTLSAVAMLSLSSQRTLSGRGQLAGKPVGQTRTAERNSPPPSNGVADGGILARPLRTESAAEKVPSSPDSEGAKPPPMPATAAGSPTVATPFDRGATQLPERPATVVEQAKQEEPPAASRSPAPSQEMRPATSTDPATSTGKSTNPGLPRPTDRADLPAPAMMPDAPEAKKPVPSTKECEEAARKIRALLSGDAERAKRPSDHLALCDKLLALALDSQDDPAEQFALFREAREQAVLATDYTKALSIGDQVAELFDVSVWQWKVETIQLAADSAKVGANRKSLALAARDLVDRLCEVGQFDLANEVAQVGVTAAARAREAELGKSLRQQRDRLARARRKWSEAEELQKQLALDPANPELNGRYGEYLCLERGDWKNGLSHLLQGDKEAVRDAAQQEQGAERNLESLSAASDAWYRAAESVGRDYRESALARSLYWARLALLQATGLARVPLESRIAELERKLPDSAKVAALAASAGNKPVVSGWRPPEGFQGLLGRIQLEGKDVGVLWKYSPGLQLTDAAVMQLLQQAGLPRGRMRIEFVGLLMLESPSEIEVSHRGGVSGGGQAAIAVDGRRLGEVGGARATSDKYTLYLDPGEHHVQWTLEGAELGVCVVQFRDVARGATLPPYHTPALLNAVRDTPFRARVNVNMIQN